MAAAPRRRPIAPLAQERREILGDEQQPRGESNRERDVDPREPVQASSRSPVVDDHDPVDQRCADQQEEGPEDEVGREHKQIRNHGPQKHPPAPVPFKRRRHGHPHRIRRIVAAAKRWVFVGHQVDVSERATREAQVAGDEVVKPLRVAPSEQQREPCDERSHVRSDCPQPCPYLQRYRQKPPEERRAAMAPLGEVGLEHHLVGHCAPPLAATCIWLVRQGDRNRPLAASSRAPAPHKRLGGARHSAGCRTASPIEPCPPMSLFRGPLAPLLLRPDRVIAPSPPLGFIGVSACGL